MMKSILLLTIVVALPLVGVSAEDTVVQMPEMKVPATRFERYTVVEQIGPPDGTFRLVLSPGPSAGTLAILVGGVHPGDEIVRIDGKDVSTMKRGEWPRELYGNFKLVIKRPVGRRSFKLLEIDGRRA